MRSKLIFDNPKWPKSDFQNGRRQPFCEKKLKLRIDLKWREMLSKVIFDQNGPNRTYKMAAGRHFEKKKFKKSCILI